MKVILINPNSTEAMTLSSVETAQKTAPEINFEGWTSFDGPPSIQGEEDGNYAIKPMLELVKKANKKKPSAIIIGLSTFSLSIDKVFSCTSFSTDNVFSASSIIFSVSLGMMAFF